MGLTKKMFLGFMLFLLSSGLCAQGNELPEKYSSLKEMRDDLQTREDIIERNWKNILEAVKDDGVSQSGKIALVETFISDFPENKYIKKANEILLKLKVSSDVAKEYLKGEKFRTKTEWFALSFFGGSYGLGGGFTFITLRWRYVFWEVFRVQATGARYFEKDRAGTSANMKTMVGIPIFLGNSKRHEIRIATGFSGGFNAKYPKNVDWDFSFYDESFIHVPIDIYYVFHTDQPVALQIGFAIDIPIPISSFDECFPIMNGFIGFRI